MTHYSIHSFSVFRNSGFVVVMMCMDTGEDRRTFMKRVSLLGMVSDEYVYVLLGTRGFGFGEDPEILSLLLCVKVNLPFFQAS